MSERKKIDLKCPAELLKADPPGEGRDGCVLTLFNLTDRPLVSCEVSLRLIDAEGETAARTVHRARALAGRPHSAFKMTVPMAAPEKKVTVTAVLEKIWYEDNEVWRRSADNETEYTPNALPNSPALQALRFAAGETAVGFPAQHTELWVCVCGRPNVNETDRCVRCGLAKKQVFERFNRRAVEESVRLRERQLDLGTRALREENRLLQMEREAEYNRKKEHTGRAVKMAVAFVAAAVLVLSGVFLLKPWLEKLEAETAPAVTEAPAAEPASAPEPTPDTFLVQDEEGEP